MLIALSGLAGSGKTTAITYLERLGVGANVYVGAFVTMEVERLALPAGPQSEKTVRNAMRQERGMDALAREALPTIRGILGAGRSALVDAIYNREERDFYERELGDRMMCIGIETSFTNRAERLSRRPGRPLSPTELETRDRFEIDTLCLGDVIASAHCRLTNDGSLDDFEDALKNLARDRLV